MKPRTDAELEQLTQRLMAAGSKVCPDCGQSTLSITFDANYVKMRCSACDFHFEDYYGG